MSALSKYQTFETKTLTVPEFYEGETPDWKLSLKHAHFSHADDCQFIFYTGCEQSITDYERDGFSPDFCAIMKEAHNLGFDYVRLTD